MQYCLLVQGHVLGICSVVRMFFATLAPLLEGSTLGRCLRAELVA